MPTIIPETRKPLNGKPRRSLAQALGSDGAEAFERHKGDSTPSPELERRIHRLQGLLELLTPVPEEWARPSEKEVEQRGELITRCLRDVEPESVSWLWEKRLALGKLNVVHGDPGTGKTWLILDTIAHVTTGKPFCDGAPCEVGQALFVTAEDGIADTIRPRLDLLVADVSRVYCLDLVRVNGREVALDLDRNMSALDLWLQSHRDVSVVALDPLAAFLGKINSHQNNEVRAVLGRLAALAEKRGVAILAIDHLAKAPGKALHRGIGSIAFTAAPRAVWQVAADPDDPGRRLFLPVKMNLAQVDGLAFRLTDAGLVWEQGSVTLSPDDVGADVGETPRVEAKEWLRQLLRNGSCPAKDVERVAKDDGICMRTLKYAKKELGVESRRCNGMWSWAYAEKAKSKGVKS